MCLPERALAGLQPERASAGLGYCNCLYSRLPAARCAPDWERSQARGWYADAGIEVSFLSPEADEYKTTPAAKVRAGVATLAIAPTETVISSHLPRDTWKEQPRFKVGKKGLQERRLHVCGCDVRSRRHFQVDSGNSSKVCVRDPVCNCSIVAKVLYKKFCV